MKSIQKSPRSRKETYDEAAEPVHWHSELGADGNVIFVIDKIGYPKAGEPISAEIAAYALRHRRVDVVARYLDESLLPEPFRSILTDMLAARDSPEEYRLEFVRQSCGSPKGSTLASQARARARQEHIGRYALANGRHGTKKAQQEFGYSSSYIEKAKRLVKGKKDQ
jgi:hypothetical protein